MILPTLSAPSLEFFLETGSHPYYETSYTIDVNISANMIRARTDEWGMKRKREGDMIRGTGAKEWERYIEEAIAACEHFWSFN